ncbi:polycomb protein suz12-A-like [Diadema antillarum]|uniref:polycomb protein suz12-A-like n=1 Tax=Diadema antillarum TaxID=105358 RepID=UPI003A8974A3
MAPHKHSRASPRRPKLEQLKADHELFLLAFEKPTQIYRFLAARHKISPVFLRRTLTYMHRQLERKSSRKKFSVDSLLEVKENKLKAATPSGGLSGKYLTLTFNQLKWKGDNVIPEDMATVELILLKVCHKRRKDICLPIMRVSLGQCQVPMNLPLSLGSAPVQPPPSLTIPSSYFSHSNGHTVRSYRLLLQARCPTSSAMPNGSLCNGDADSSETMTDGQASKRRKVMTRLKEKELESSGLLPPPPPPQSSQPPQNHEEEPVAMFASELVVVDKQNKCQLLDGTYELALQEVQSKSTHKYHSASWETIADGKSVGPLEVPDLSPRLSFSLTWSSSDKDLEETSTLRSPERSSRSTSNHGSSNELIHSTSLDPAKHSALSNGETLSSKSTTSPLRRSQHSITTTTTVSPSKGAPSSKNGATMTPAMAEKVERVFYQFLYNNNTRQQTEARDNLRCPWCALNCLRLYSLLKHLSTCHSRFIFTYVPHQTNARIDVSINEHYDGSYSGNPQNLITSHMGYAFQRNGPCRRTPVTQILVMKPERPKESLLEFQEGENTDYLTSRPYISGHNRIYYHTHSLQPIRPQEMDEDSEDEIDPDWIKERTRMMIDEFSDVNEGEKELMKLWNNHCMKHNFIADSQIPKACSLFIEEHGATILRESLGQNFLLHLINLYDFSLLHPQLILRFMSQLERLGRRSNGGEPGGAAPEGITPSNQEAVEEARETEKTETKEEQDQEERDQEETSKPPILYPEESLVSVEASKVMPVNGANVIEDDDDSADTLEMDYGRDYLMVDDTNTAASTDASQSSTNEEEPSEIDS